MIRGFNTLENYIIHHLQRGVDLRGLSLHYCHKPLRFGNDQSLVSTTVARVPMACGGRCGRIFVYLIPGDTPFLVARPIMEALGLSIDFGTQSIRWPDQDWLLATRGQSGNYEIDLADGDFTGDYNDFDLWPDDSTISAVPDSLGDR